MNKKYYLINENNQVLDFNDMKNSVFNLLSDLGTSRTLRYSRVGNTYMKNSEELEQLSIEGKITFIKSEIENEENFKKYESFLRASSNLIFSNVRNEESGLTEMLVDVDWAQIKRAYRVGKFLVCNLTLCPKTAWYKKSNLSYSIEESQGSAFGFPIDFDNMIFDAGLNNEKTINNTGYYDAPLYIKIKGPVVNPKIEIIKNKQIINSITIPIELSYYEELEYCTRDDKLYLQKIGEDGTVTNLFDLLDENNDNNFFKLPVGASILKISAETTIRYANIVVYLQY